LAVSSGASGVSETGSSRIESDDAEERVDAEESSDLVLEREGATGQGQ
jgi:hypothetical protein